MAAMDKKLDSWRERLPDTVFGSTYKIGETFPRTR